MQRIVLDGAWQLTPVDDFQLDYGGVVDWHEQHLPAHWQELAALETHTGKVVYRKVFAYDAANPARTWLRLRGVFYRYRLRLNGQPVGEGEGYFFPQEYEVTGHLQASNELIIEVDSPVEQTRLAKETITGVFAHWDAMSSYRYNAGGLWLPVELVHHPDVHIKGAMWHLEAFDDEAAHVALRLDLRVNYPDGVPSPLEEATWRVDLVPANFEGEAVQLSGRLALPPGEYGWQQTLTIAPYKLWWTHDMGFPHLYHATVTLDGEIDHPVAWSGTIGLRMWAMKDYIAHLNGTRLYIKGSNYPPGDARLATMTRERADQDMALATGAHMNMLRIHAHVDHPAVYEAADAHGVLLWQDFPMQWLYAKHVLPQALRQSQEMVRLLYNHPSVVIWCLHNEPLHVEDTSEEPILRQLKTYWSLLFSWNRDVMGAQTTGVVGHLDRTRTIIRASGEMWVPFWLPGTDGHYYFGWYMSYGPKRWFDWWRLILKKNLRFVTEFGAQSFPNYENAKKFLPDDLRGADKKHLLEHYLLQWDLMGLWIDMRSNDLQDLVTKSQDYQSEINRYYVDRLRFLKYKPNGGFLNFMFMDSQPGVSWSLIDYWRTPKTSYDAYKQSLSPVYVFCLTPKDTYRRGRYYPLPLYVVNDLHEAVACTITATVRDPAGGEVALWTLKRDLPADGEAEPLGRMSFKPAIAGPHTLTLVLERPGAPPLVNCYGLAVVH